MKINDMAKGGKNTSTGVNRNTKTISTFPPSPGSHSRTSVKKGK